MPSLPCTRRGPLDDQLPDPWPPLTVDRDVLLDSLRGGAVVAVETTGLTSDRALGFDEALAAGRAAVEGPERKFRFAVDPQAIDPSERYRAETKALVLRPVVMVRPGQDPKP